MKKKEVYRVGYLDTYARCREEPLSVLRNVAVVLDANQAVEKKGSKESIMLEGAIQAVADLMQIAVNRAEADRLERRMDDE